MDPERIQPGRREKQKQENEYKKEMKRMEFYNHGRFVFKYPTSHAPIISTQIAAITPVILFTVRFSPPIKKGV